MKAQLQTVWKTARRIKVSDCRLQGTCHSPTTLPPPPTGVAYLLGQHERTSSSELLARRIAHLAVAAPPLFVLIGVVFYLLHFANGDSVLAAFSHEFNQAMMNSLRKWYRSEVVQPVLVTLMLFQVVSGVILFWRATATPSDLSRTLQTSTGAFLTAFIVSHLNAVFILGRAVTKVDTTFLWASGAPAHITDAMPTLIL